MAVTINTQIENLYTWGSCDYTTWGVNKYNTWGNTYRRNINLISNANLIIADMVVAINTKMEKTYTWDSYDYLTWGGSKYTTWGSAYRGNISLTSVENLSAADMAVKSYKKLMQEQFDFDDKHARITAKTLQENIRIADMYSKKFVADRFFCEDVYVDDLAKKSQFKPFVEDIVMLEDKCINNFSLAPKENISIVDFINRTFVATRKWNENVLFKDLQKKDIVLAKKEDAVGIRDAILQASGGVISNLYITEGAYNIQQFADALDTPPGYNKFTDFKVGEYEYQEALVRIILSAVNQSQPTASGVTMHIDIPDTDDRGTAKITDTSAPTKVYLTKHFYVVPEVQVTLKNGNIGSGFITPNIVSVDGEDEYGRYFTVELLTSSGDRTTGTISWAAKGY